MSTTGQPSRSAAASAASTSVTRSTGWTAMPTHASTVRACSWDSQLPSVGSPRSADLAARTSVPGRSRSSPSGRARHSAYPTTRDRARAADSGEAYDGTEPRAGAPSSPGTASAGGTPSAPRKLASTGTGPAAAARRTAPSSRATRSRSRPCGGGTTTASTASTSSLASTMSSAAASSAAAAYGPRSTGPRPVTPPIAWSRSQVASDSSGTSRSCSRRASAAIEPSAEELPTTPTRRPCGSGCRANSWAVVNSWPSERTRTTPAEANSASTATSPAPCPLFRATTGLVRPSRRAIRANLRGLPKPCRCSTTTSVRASACQCCSRSLPDTSARSPIDTNADSPSERRSASARKVPASAPDWDRTPTRPTGGAVPAKVACRRIAGSVLTTPMAFGPISRMPPARASRTTSSSRARPSGPASAKPPDTTTRPRTRLSAQARTTSATSAAGTAMTARSTASGTEAMSR